MKRLIALLLSICCVLPLVACGDGEGPAGPGDGGESGFVYNVQDGNNTEIQFANFTGGVGDVWLKRAAEAFAKNNQTKSFGQGKEGVYINIYNYLSEGPTLYSDMSGAPYHMYTYDLYERTTAREMGNSSKALCIDEVAKDTGREGGVLSSKISNDLKFYMTDAEGHFYGLPHYQSYSGISANYKLFKDNGWLIADPQYAGDADVFESGSKYVARDDEGVAINPDDEIYFTGNVEKLHPGNDGISGNSDDGFPISGQQLLAVCEAIYESGLAKPFVIAGSMLNYSNMHGTSLWQGFAGVDQMRSYFDADGSVQIVKHNGTNDIIYVKKGGGETLNPAEAENLIPGIDYVKKPVVETYTLNATNGYQGQWMYAKYLAFAMYDIFHTEGYFSQDTFLPERNNYDADQALIFEGKGVYEAVAMLIEGSYWYNEAVAGGSFKSAQINCGIKRNETDIRFMPIQTSFFTADHVDAPGWLLANGASCMVINKNIENNTEIKSACIEFMKFLYSEEWLQDFTMTTGMLKGCEFTMNDTVKNGMGGFYRGIVEMVEDGYKNEFLGSTDAYFKNKYEIGLGYGSGPFKRTIGIFGLTSGSKTAADAMVESLLAQDQWI